jgi:hypothetical protein
LHGIPCRSANEVGSAQNNSSTSEVPFWLASGVVGWVVERGKKSKGQNFDGMNLTIEAVRRTLIFRQITVKQ